MAPSFWRPKKWKMFSKLKNSIKLIYVIIFNDMYKKEWLVLKTNGYFHLGISLYMRKLISCAQYLILKLIKENHKQRKLKSRTKVWGENVTP